VLTRVGRRKLFYELNLRELLNLESPQACFLHMLKRAKCPTFLHQAPLTLEFLLLVGVHIYVRESHTAKDVPDPATSFSRPAKNMTRTTCPVLAYCTTRRVSNEP